MRTEREQLIFDAIAFMQSLIHHYGQVKGLEVFEKLADHADHNLKGDVFVAMLTGQYNGRIKIYQLNNITNAVTCIKTLRNVDNRRLGLKEAKDLYDDLRYNNKPIHVEVDGKNRQSAVKELRMAGFVV